MLAASSAQAMSITWNFQNAIFDDATELTGSFDFDMSGDIFSSDAYSNVSLNTEDGVIGAQHYDGVTILAGSFGFVSAAGSFLDSQILGVAFKDALSNAVDSIDIAGGMEAATVITGFFEFETVSRKLISGMVVSNQASATGGTPAITLPEPAAFVIFMTGLIAVFALRRRAII